MGRQAEPVIFHREVLGASQLHGFGALGGFMTQAGFYLGGGTAIALYLGHRHSVDLDWFTPARMEDPEQIAHSLEYAGIHFVARVIRRGTLHGKLFGVRVSMLEYRYPLLCPTVAWGEFGCQIAALDDLACMKLAAVAQRGDKKDFVDIYALGMRGLSLGRMLGLYERRYAALDIGQVLYGLTYFADADKQRMPRMLWNVDWREMKATLRAWAKQAA